MVPWNVYGREGPATPYVNVRKPSGDLDIGTAFHVGDGVMVTAKHVVSSNEIVAVATTSDAYIERKGGFRMPYFGDTEFATVRIENAGHLGPPLQCSYADIAAFRIELPDPGFPEIFVGGYGDGSEEQQTATKRSPVWMKEHLLETAFVLGYPSIPSTKEPILVGLRCDVCAIVENRYLGNDHPHFVLSSMARGGFSGGPVFGANGFLIGLVTEALLRDNLPAELGYMAAVPVDMIARFLKEVGMLPKRNPWAMLAGSDPKASD